MTNWRDGGQCPVCGGSGVRASAVLDEVLLRAWELTPAEAELINRQQGECCAACGANLRSRTLAAALLERLGCAATLRALTETAPPLLRLLEINAAGTHAAPRSIRPVRLWNPQRFMDQHVELMDAWERKAHKEPRDDAAQARGNIRAQFRDRLRAVVGDAIEQADDGVGLERPRT